MCLRRLFFYIRSSVFLAALALENWPSNARAIGAPDIEEFACAVGPHRSGILNFMFTLLLSEWPGGSTAQSNRSNGKRAVSGVWNILPIASMPSMNPGTHESDNPTMKSRKIYSTFLLLTLFSHVMDIPAHASDLRGMLLSDVGKQTAAVRSALLSLRTTAEVKAFGDSMRQVLRELNDIDRDGPRVNARMVGKIELKRFTIEKVIFESAPGIFVPANVYVPKDIRGRVPAVRYVNGHSAAAMSGANEMCQGFCSQGYVVMTFDPMGQGERGIYYDRFSGNEHVTEGLRAYAVGSHMSKLFIGDGMYAVDYLISRSDVDSTRICVTGNSGGGAQSLYLGAIDPRVAVSIPSCFTTLDSLILADTPTHPESIYFGAFVRGVTNETLCAMTAPRALLINASKEDFFPIAGTRVVYRTAKAVYTAAGAPDKTAMFEGEGGHAYPLQKQIGRAHV